MNLEVRKEEAKRIVSSHLFRTYAQELAGDMAAVQHRIRERKALMAMLHLLNINTSPVLTREAELRGIPVADLAGSILSASSPLNDTELERVRLNVAIENCTKVSDIGKLLIDNRVPLPPGVNYLDAEPEILPPLPTGPVLP